MDDISLGYTLRGAVFQLIVFLLIPVIWWAIKWRKKKSLFNFLGLYIPKHIESKKAVFIICLYCGYWIVSHLPIITQFTQPSSNRFLNKGIEAVIPALIASLIQTALSEEILFRGFILKRFKTIMSENMAILLQATLFGLTHNLFAWNVPFITHILIFLPAFFGGYFLGYINEKIFKGSILPSIAMHGIGNSIINISRVFGL